MKSSSFTKRVHRLFSLLAKKNVDAMIVRDMVDIRYLTGFTGTASWLCLVHKKKHLYVDFRYFEQAQKEVDSRCRVIKWTGDEKDLWEDIQKKIKGLRCGVDGKSFSLQIWRKMKRNMPNCAWLVLEDVIRIVRSQKDAEEIHAIKKALDIAEAAFRQLCGMIKPGLTEKDIQIELDYRLKQMGAEKSAFDIIVLSGQRSSWPHGQAGRKKIRHNNVILIDFGAVWRGYHSDLTRILALGKMPHKFKRIFNIINEAKHRAIQNIKPGISARVVDEVARDYIKSQGFAKYFGHGLGHGLGLEIHEYPVLSPRSRDVLKENMVFTIEPGIYCPGLGGIRVEEDVLVTKNGVSVLSRSQKNIIEI